MNRILVVVDMQNDFIDGALGTPEAVSIVDAVIEKVKTYPVENIYATRDTHLDNYLETQEGKRLPVKHCIKGTEGWKLNSRVAAALGDARVIDKPTFGSEELVKELKLRAAKEETEIELVGLCTDICVVSNALLLKAAMPEVKILLDSACCAGVTPESHQAALTTMRMCQIEVG